MRNQELSFCSSEPREQRSSLVIPQLRRMSKTWAQHSPHISSSTSNRLRTCSWPHDSCLLTSTHPSYMEQGFTGSTSSANIWARLYHYYTASLIVLISLRISAWSHVPGQQDPVTWWPNLGLLDCSQTCPSGISKLTRPAAPWFWSHLEGKMEWGLWDNRTQLPPHSLRFLGTHLTPRQSLPLQSCVGQARSQAMTRQCVMV